MVRDSEGPLNSAAEPTTDPKTLQAQSQPKESQDTLTSQATRSDSIPAPPMKGPVGPLQSEGNHQASGPASGTTSPSTNTDSPAEHSKGTPKPIPQTQVVTSQPEPSSSVSSGNQIKNNRSNHDASMVKIPAAPKLSSPRSSPKQGQRKPSPLNHGLEPTPAPALASKPNSFSTDQQSSTPSPRYPLTAKQRMTKGKFLIRKRLYEEAVKVLDPLFESHPSHWEPWFWMGTAHLGLRNLEQAETFFMEGLVRDDTVPHLWVHQGLVYQLQEQHEKAIGAFRHAERLAPDFPEVHLNLAHVLESQGNSPMALKYYRQYLTLTEKDLENRSIRKKVLGKIVGLEGS